MHYKKSAIFSGKYSLRLKTDAAHHFGVGDLTYLSVISLHNAL